MQDQPFEVDDTPTQELPAFTPLQRAVVESVNKLKSEYPDALVTVKDETGRDTLSVHPFASYMSELGISQDPEKQAEFQEMSQLSKQVTDLNVGQEYIPADNPSLYQNVFRGASTAYEKTFELTPNGIKFKNLDGGNEFQPVSTLGQNDKKRLEAYLKLSDITGKAIKAKAQAASAGV